MSPYQLIFQTFSFTDLRGVAHTEQYAEDVSESGVSGGEY